MTWGESEGHYLDRGVEELHFFWPISFWFLKESISWQGPISMHLHFHYYPMLKTFFLLVEPSTAKTNATWLLWFQKRWSVLPSSISQTRCTQLTWHVCSFHMCTITSDMALEGVESEEVKAALLQLFEPFTDSCGFPLFSHNWKGRNRQGKSV